MDKKKKASKNAIRAIALVALFCLAFVMTSSRIWAFEIDTSSFSQPSRDVEDFYYWHEGLPPQNKLGENGISQFGYPTLITWNNTYYWATDMWFYRSFATQQNPVNTPEYNSKDDLDKWGEYNGEYSLYIGLKVYWSNYYPHGNYRILCDYPAGRISEITEFDFDVLRQYGSTISFTLPEIPVLYAADASKAVYATDDAKYAGNEYPTYFITGSGTGGRRAASNAPGGILTDPDAIAASRVADAYNPTDQCTIFSPYMYTYSYVERATYYLGDTDYRQHTNIAFYPRLQYKGKNYLQTTDATNYIQDWCWQFIPSGSGYYYGIRGDGYVQMNVVRISDDDKFYGDYFKDYKTLERWRDDKKEANIVIRANGEYLRAHGDRSGYTPSFRIYYAEWNPISYLNQSFEVQNGQVTSLEGPIVIPQDTVITVKDGGVFSVKGWVINNGKIVIEPGGTLIMQEDSVLSCTEKRPGLPNGQILCNGLMIVSSNAKVHAGGIYGMSFGEGAQCVNYGTLIAENFFVAMDHTIENRGENSSVFAGYGISDTGYNLQQIQINSVNSFNKTTIEKTRTVKIPPEGIYGNGGRVIKNPDSNS